MTIPFAGLRDTVAEFTGAGAGSRILDVATGTGKQAFAFAKKGYDVTGVDLSEDMLRVAKKKNKYGNARFEIADATALRFGDCSFDVSCISFALHDMPPGVRERVLREMVRVTRPDGMIVVVDYALPSNRIWRFLVYHFVRQYERYYYPEFIKSDLDALLGSLGIGIKEKRSVLLGTGRILKGSKKAK
ncbi:MAG TPA: methyltransferase domain-containing protein [Candidatus Methanoperedenaceae archaeon]|nr:methyltransferase domain-containing protein [Candidatus Methanoperedenaceae archaeon]